ncbi:MAG: hypothetical protein ACRDHN_02270, partial [Thermomicrobiales bacterium]
GDIMLVSVGAPAPIGDTEPAATCVPPAASLLPVSLETAIPVISCTAPGSGQFQQVIVFEFAPGTSASLNSLAGSISLTMAIAP